MWESFLGHWRVWVPLVCVGAATLLGFLISQEAEVRIRYCGLGFELAGIVTVALGLEDRRRLFDLPNPIQPAWNRLKQWCSRWWRRKGHGITPLTGTLRIGPARVFGKASTWRGIGTDTGLENRVDVLESNVKTLRSEQDELVKELSQESRARGEELATERRAREESDQQLNKKLGELGAGNLHLEWLGIFWLLIGLILTTTSSELASLSIFRAIP